jgi:hypothetical protein
MAACSSILLRNQAREFSLRNVARIAGVQSKPGACNLSVKVVSAWSVQWLVVSRFRVLGPHF